ncbi:hypothetical protein BC827DRAFT_1146294 [Russula dissimulans]|nr:hypothetical protein BC827DRAFT_1146294 [Russula dissimulans]
MQFFTVLLSALALAASTSTASPVLADVAAAAVKRSDDIVVTPAVTSPSQGSNWVVGTTQYVQWDTSNIPIQGRGQTGTLLLGYNDGKTSSENLDVYHPLGQGFKLTSGSYPIIVPKVPQRNTYFIVLIGDSGNKSPYFTISQNKTA